MSDSNPTVFTSGRVREFLTVDNQTSAPDSTTSRLYNLNGVLYFDGVSLEASGGPGGGASLDEVYQNGRTVTVNLGALIFNDATSAAANTFEFNKTGAGSGNILDFDFTAAFTGAVLNIDFGSALAANGVIFDSEGQARTGSDILFTDDSTGTHILIDGNSSGAGKSTFLDWTDSYTGSNASIGMLLTMGNSNGLSSQGIQIVRGTGVRTASAINIDDSSTGNVAVVDIDISGAYTGDILSITTSAAATGNIILLDLTSAVAATALRVVSTGVRTQPLFEVADDQTGAVSLYSIVTAGATWSGHVFEVSMDAATTGDVHNVDMNAAVGGRFLYLDAGAAIRTAVLIDILADGSGNAGSINIDESNTGSGQLIDINVSGIGSGNVLDITYSAADTGNALSVVMADNVAGGALVITGAGARTDSLIDIVTSETGSMDGIVYVEASGVFTGSVVTLKSSAAATTGSLLHFNLDAGVAYKAVTFDHAGARTVATILSTFDGTFGATGGGTFLDANISMTGALASPFIDIDVSDVYTGNIFDYASSAAATGTVLAISMGSSVAAKLAQFTVTGVRTADLITITDDSSGAVDLFQVTSTSTSSGHIFNIDVDSVFTGNVLDIAFGTSAATGEAIKVVMGTNVAGSAIVLTGTGSRTDDLIKIDDDSTSNSSVFDINLTGAFTTAYAFDLAATGVHTSGLMNLTSDSSSAGARILLNIVNDNTAATGTVPLTITQDAVTSTNFKLMMTLGTIKIFISDQTTPNAALSAAEGSICLNGSATGQAFWNTDGSTAWTALA